MKPWDIHLIGINSQINLLTTVEPRFVDSLRSGPPLGTDYAPFENHHNATPE